MNSSYKILFRLWKRNVWSEKSWDNVKNFFGEYNFQMEYCSYANKKCLIIRDVLKLFGNHLIMSEIEKLNLKEGETAHFMKRDCYDIHKKYYSKDLKLQEHTHIQNLTFILEEMCDIPFEVAVHHNSFISGYVIPYDLPHLIEINIGEIGGNEYFMMEKDGILESVSIKEGDMIIFQ